MLANMMLCLGHFAVNPLVVSYSKSLNASESLTGFLAGMFFGVALAMRPISGPMITKMDKRKLLFGVFALGAIANLGYALFPTIPAFVLFRFVNGAQYSFVGSLIMTRVSDSLPPEKMGTGLGVYGVGGAIGMSIAPSIGNWIVERSGGYDLTSSYRPVFLYAMTIMILALIPCIISTPDEKTTEKAEVGAWYKNIFTMKCLPVAIVMLFLIIAYSAYNNYMVEFAKQMNIPNVSLFFSVLAIALMVSRPVLGPLMDKIGGRKVMLPMMGIFGASFLITGTAKTLTQLLVAAVVIAIGYGAAQPSLQAAALRAVPVAKRGVASNTIYIGMDLGFFLSPLISAQLAERTGSYGTMYLITTVFVVIAMVILFFLWDKMKPLV
jgi:Arabinose efflux permease